MHSAPGDDGMTLPARHADAIAGLLSELDEHELALVMVSAAGEFTIAQNLALYTLGVGSLSRGALYVVEDLEALCGYREDLDEAVAALEPGRLRDLLVEAIDKVDVQFLGVTVPGSPPWRRSPDSGSWWWHRVLRRTDQRRFMDSDWQRPRPPQHGES